MVADVLIVGAGLSGLVAANIIQPSGKSLAMLDKGRSTGGRLATRRIAEGCADHGAQFFTARNDIFKQQVNQWLEDDLIYIWGHGWSDGSLKRTYADGYPRYATRGGMNQLAKSLASNIETIHVQTRVSDVHWSGAQWKIATTENETFESRVLILTAPVPQSLELIKSVELAPSDLSELKRIEYGACLCGLFVVDGEVDLPAPGARQNFDDTVYWIADNKAKGISEKRIITMHADSVFSGEHYDKPEEDTLAYLDNALQDYLIDGATVQESQLKKWRYSIPLTTYPHDILQAEGLPLIFAGDAFGGRGRVEGAYLSGYAAGNAAIELLDK